MENLNISMGKYVMGRPVPDSYVGLLVVGESCKNIQWQEVSVCSDRSFSCYQNR